MRKERWVVELQDIQLAQQRLVGYVRRTPLLIAHPVKQNVNDIKNLYLRDSAGEMYLQLIMPCLRIHSVARNIQTKLHPNYRKKRVFGRAQWELLACIVANKVQ